MSKDPYWMEHAVPPSHRGKLHRALGVPMGQKIPAKKLEKAAHSKSTTLKREANFAKIAKKVNR